MDILRQTLRTTQTVASAMAGVVGFWSNGVAESRCQFGVANQVNDIESEFSNVGTLMMRSRTYIYEHWLDIEQNNMLQAEVAEYLERVKVFLHQLRIFEEMFCKNDEKAFDMFRDVWIARKYFVLMLELEQIHKDLMLCFEEYCNKRPSVAKPFRGMASEFRDFFVGVSDTELESLILYNKPFRKKSLWKGERVEATIFAKTFGLSAKVMNRCFVINGSNGFHRDLNLSGDKPSYMFSNYGIYAHLEKFRHCWV